MCFTKVKYILMIPKEIMFLMAVVCDSPVTNEALGCIRYVTPVFCQFCMFSILCLQLQKLQADIQPLW